MKVRVNGDDMELPVGETISSLLTRLSLNQSRVAVERNLDIVPKAVYAETTIYEDDVLEIVSFVGGG